MNNNNKCGNHGTIIIIVCHGHLRDKAEPTDLVAMFSALQINTSHRRIVNASYRE